MRRRLLLAIAKALKWLAYPFKYIYNSIIPTKINKDSELPADYQQVEYIKSTGTQYIDTGFYPNSQTSFEIEYKLPNNYDQYNVLGCWENTSNAFLITATNNNTFVRCGGDTNMDFPIILDQKVNAYVSLNKAIVNGQTLTSTNTSSLTRLNVSMLLFGRNNIGTIQTGGIKTIYSCKIYDNNVLVRNFVPCYRKSDNTIGLFDTVNQVFYTNAGTGTFLKGADSAYAVQDKARIDTLIGNSEVENQLNSSYNKTYSENGIDFVVANDGKVSISGIATAQASYYNYSAIIRALAGHKILIIFKKAIGISFANVGSSTTIFEPVSTYGYGFVVANGTNLTTAYETYVRIIDLTQRYPFDTPTSLDDPRVKNIITRLESGEDSGKYNAGTIKNSVISEIDSQGFNIWNEQMELGIIDGSTGQDAYNSNRLRNIGYINVLPSENYYCSIIPCYIRFYDKNKNFIGKLDVIDASQQLFTTSSDCAYMRFCLNQSYGTTYKNDICVNRSSDLNGTYKPYPLINIWNEEWEEGELDANGQDREYNGKIRTKGYISVNSSTSYYVYVGGGYGCFICFYNANRTFISSITPNNEIFETPSNCAYIRFNLGTNYGGTYKNDICISLSNPANNGKYIRFGANKIQLPAPLEIGGVGSAHNTFAITKTEYVFTRNAWNYTFTGSETWTVSSGWGYAVATIANLGGKLSSKKIIGETNAITKYEIGSSNTNVLAIYLDTTTYDTSAKINALTSGKTITYELTTPQVISIPRKHMRVVRLSDLEWVKSNSTTGGFYCNASSLGYKYSVDTQMFCSKYFYEGISSSNPYYGNDKSIKVFYSQNQTPRELYIVDTDYTDANAFKSAMSNVWLFYETENEVADFANEMSVQSGGVINARQSRVPHEYQECEYIESTGTQYIDTGINVSTNIGVDIGFKQTQLLLSENDDHIVFGARDEDKRFWLDMDLSNGQASGKVYFGYGTYNLVYEGVRDKTKKFVFKTNVNGNTTGSYELLYNNGSISSGTVSTASLPNGKSIFLFKGNYETSYPAEICLYYCKIYDNGTLVRNFIPCYRKSDNVIGLYDTVGGTFYTNAGTGTFLKGADIDSPICEVLPNAVMDFTGKTGYKRLNYIESSGTQYIDTGLKADNNVGASLDIAVNNKTDQIVFGIQSYFQIGANGSIVSGDQTKVYFGWNGTNTQQDNRYLTDLSVRHNYQFNYLNNRKSYIDDEEKSNMVLNYSTISTISQYTITLFVRRQDDGTLNYYSNSKVYGCKISNGSTIVRDFVPMQRLSDNAIGLYDLVENKFYENAGTGEFIGG